MSHNLKVSILVNGIEVGGIQCECSALDMDDSLDCMLRMFIAEHMPDHEIIKTSELNSMRAAIIAGCSGKSGPKK